MAGVGKFSYVPFHLQAFEVFIFLNHGQGSGVVCTEEWYGYMAIRTKMELFDFTSATDMSASTLRPNDKVVVKGLATFVDSGAMLAHAQHGKAP